MTNMNVKTGDTVVVLTGKDAGKQGKVLKVSPKDNRIVVEGVNIVSKTHKARSAQDKSEIRKVEGTIDASNVMIVCPKCGKATRVHHAIVDGKKVRTCKCGANLNEKAAKVEKKTAKKVETKDETVAEEKPVKKAATKTTKTASTKTTKTAETKVKATKTATTKSKIATGKSAQRGV